MMPSKKHKTARSFLGWGTVALGALCVVALSRSDEALLQGLLVRTKTTNPPWATISAEKVMSGTLIPANTHVVFHLPVEFASITRETLLGLKGKKTRYWGYCFPANYDPKNVDARRGFPGLIFLSEKERAARAAAERARKPAFRIGDLPDEKEVEEANGRPLFPIRHQLEVFKPGTMCYIMTEASLAIGLDFDNDRLNDKLEAELDTNVQTPDSDGDGISDGTEYVYGTIPSMRDTDGDGVIDGIEDSDRDGRIDLGETNPRLIDSDRDNICDGMCRVRLQRQYIYIGEDPNLNGEVDEGELDPTKFDTDADGEGDEVEYLRCIARGDLECP